MVLDWDPVLNTTLFFDELLVYSELKPTDSGSLSHHFDLLAKVVCLALHKAKVGFLKSTFAQTQVKYLGWIMVV